MSLSKRIARPGADAADTASARCASASTAADRRARPGHVREDDDRAELEKTVKGKLQVRAGQGEGLALDRGPGRAGVGRLRRHPRLRPDQPVPGRRQRDRDHGQRAGSGVRRAGGQDRARRRRVHGREPPAAADREDRQPGRPPHRRVDADGRRPAARWLPGERGRVAPCRRRSVPHHPKVRRGPLRRRRPHRVRHHHAARPPPSSRPACWEGSTSSCPAAPAPARRPRSTCCRTSSRRRSGSSRSRTPRSFSFGRSTC